MTGFARFSSYDAPIRLSTAALSEFMGTIGSEATPEKLQSLAKANSTVFAIEVGEEEIYLLTTRAGRSPVESSTDSDHTFSVRFMTPLPKPERTAPVRERVVADEPNWLREVFVPGDSLDLLAETAARVPQAVTPQPVVETVDEAEPALAAEEPLVAEAEAAVPAPRTITVPPVEVQSFGGVDDLRLAAAIGDRLRQDPRVANFGDDWMLEERVPRLGRNDLRRLREYLTEQEQPLTDEALAQDVLGGRLGTPDFEQLRFCGQLSPLSRASGVRLRRYYESAVLEHEQPAPDRHHSEEGDGDCDGLPRHRRGPEPAGDAPLCRVYRPRADVL
jgi:hypothetical protein